MVHRENQRVRQYLTNLTRGFFCRDRQRRKRRVSRLKSGLVRLTIRQTLASRTLDGKVRTFPVMDAKGDAVGIAEVKF